ncbi:hypothetical protein SLEP1_g13060 [Rubroshorea leprosula]|uniref:RING-type E3 ubiquitin transferase n=1 Tax=Rubroshorea leprosula TaxID=152421 RepID=A0AAV5IPA8_9ROSI|nr:hypothetical protein SLEP1_g13060 [Rubroshorea leprosula]
MGVFHPKTFILFFFLLLLIPPAFADDNQINSLPGVNTSSSSSPPPLSMPEYSPFKPTIAIIVGVLTTMFSIIFLLLLYAKHCQRNRSLPNSSGLAPAPRKNSGIHRAVIESLPIFRFSSLRGEKDGLECAVCLNKFEPTEVLRLLPKCKHAFHVECVDTWLDAHSTCPLCRYRVDPEDILLIGDTHVLHENEQIPPHSDPILDPGPKSWTQPVSGRHSSAGERTTALLQKPGDPEGEPGCSRNPASYRRSLDSSTSTNINETVNIARFDRPRKDGLLLGDGGRKSTASDRKLEHRIIVSGGTSALQQRWSDVQPSDLLHLRSEMIINESERRMSTSTSVRKQEQRKRGRIEEGDRSVIKTRSVSEIMGLGRFSFSSSGHHHHHRHRERDGVLPRWSDVGSGRTAIGSS